MKRLVILVAVLVVLAGGAAGVLALRHHSSATATSATRGPPVTRVSSTSTTATIPVFTPPTTFPPHIYGILYAGCTSLQAVGAIVSQASGENSTAPMTAGKATLQWRDVSIMQLVGSDPIYIQIADDTRTFLSSWSLAETYTGDVPRVNGSIARLVVDCQELNLYPQ